MGGKGDDWLLGMFGVDVCFGWVREDRKEGSSGYRLGVGNGLDSCSELLEGLEGVRREGV